MRKHLKVLLRSHVTRTYSPLGATTTAPRPPLYNEPGKNEDFKYIHRQITPVPINRDRHIAKRKKMAQHEAPLRLLTKSGKSPDSCIRLFACPRAQVLWITAEAEVGQYHNCACSRLQQERYHERVSERVPERVREFQARQYKLNHWLSLVEQLVEIVGRSGIMYPFPELTKSAPHWLAHCLHFCRSPCPPRQLQFSNLAPLFLPFSRTMYITVRPFSRQGTYLKSGWKSWRSSKVFPASGCRVPASA